jgi:hypothetical protein
MHRDIEPGPSRSSDVRVGRSVIAVIGIDHYAEWPRLENAVSDAMAVSRLFKQLGFEEVTPPLLDEAATGDAMRRLVTDDLGQLSPDDSLLLFFAGHGYTHATSFGDVAVKTGCVMPVDATGPRSHVSASWLRLDNWLSDIARLSPRHILVIVDACHSGVALSAPRWRDNEAQPAELNALQSRRSRRIITSALDDQRAMDSGPVHGHSLFTGCLIEGLSGELAEGDRRVVTGREIGQYLQQRVRSYSQWMQTPDAGEFELDDRGDIVVPVRCKEPASWEPTSISSVTSVRGLWSALSSVWTAPRRLRDGAKIWVLPSSLERYVQSIPMKLATAPESWAGRTIKGIGPAASPPTLAPNSYASKSMPGDRSRAPAFSRNVIVSQPRKAEATSPQESPRHSIFLRVARPLLLRRHVALALAILLVVSYGVTLVLHGVFADTDPTAPDAAVQLLQYPPLPSAPLRSSPLPSVRQDDHSARLLATSKIVLETPVPAPVYPTRPGVVETILGDRSSVSHGDVIARLVGYKPIAAQLKLLAGRWRQLQAQSDEVARQRATAQAAHDKTAEAAIMAKIDDLEKALTLMQHQLADRTTELDSFLIHAHSGGTFHPIVRSGQQVSADSVVAEIQPTIPIATFHIDDPQPFAVNASVELAICKGEQRVTCTIVDVQPDSVKVSCPAHPPLAEGTAVALKPPG